MNLKIYLGSSSTAMADREKKRKMLKFLRLENEKSFLDGMKNIFHRAIISLKIKTCLKIADTSFKLNLVTFTLITMIYFLI